MENALKAFRDMKFPANKMKIIENCKSLNCHNEVINALETCADREYKSCSDVMMECKGKINC
jgi:hypothetical protein